MFRLIMVLKRIIVVLIMIPDVYYYTDRNQNRKLLLSKETSNFAAEPAGIVLQT